MNRIDEAVKLFEEGYVCSQAVFAVFSEDYGISKSDALKIGACFGSGMRKGEVCGACTGSLMALGLKYGDDKARSNEACERFLEYICRDLLGCDISTEEGVKYAIENNLFREFCPKMVESATEIAEKLMDGD